MCEANRIFYCRLPGALRRNLSMYTVPISFTADKLLLARILTAVCDSLFINRSL